MGGRKPTQKILGCLKTDRPGANSKRPNETPKRLEIHGVVQAEITERMLELSKGYDLSPAGREAFWKAAKPIMGNIERKRMKKMMRKLEKIKARAEKAKGGLVGSTKRGYNLICQAWDSTIQNKGMREAGAGRKPGGPG